MLTQREDFNVFDNDKFIVVFVENSTIDKVPDIFLIAFGEIHHGIGIPFRCPSQSFSFWVFPNALKNSSDSLRKLLNSLFCLFRRGF